MKKMSWSSVHKMKLSRQEKVKAKLSSLLPN